MADEAIQKHTPATAADVIKDKIHAAWAELVSPEQWKAMIEAELRQFTTAPPRGQWSNETPVSPFSAMIRAEVTRLIKDNIQATLASPEWSAKYDAVAGRQVVGDAIGEWLTKNAGTLVQATIMELAGAAAQNLVRQMTGR